MSRNRQAAFLLLGLVVSTLAARALFLGQPILNVDDQFYQLVGYRIQQGALPYVDIWDRKPPGLFAIYWLIHQLGTSVWIHQLTACGFIVATSLAIRQLALRMATPAGATIAAFAYGWWTALCGGATGQSPVFYNLFMALAALCVVLLIERGRGVAGQLKFGMAAMLLAGLAFQVKSSSIIESAFFGLAILVVFWRSHRPLVALAMAAACAITFTVPTLAAVAILARGGELDAMFYATVLSIADRGQMRSYEFLVRFISTQAMILPLLGFALVGFVRRAKDAGKVERDVRTFLYLWLVVALLATAAYRGFYFDHYVLPVLVPACICAAAAWSEWRRLKWAMGLTAIALVAANFSLQYVDRAQTGGWKTIEALRLATEGQRNCPFNFGGPPIAAVLNHWCAVTPWEFPLHLSYAPEAGAVGTDTVGEVARILATHPDRVIIRMEPNRNPNRRTREMVERALHRDYRLVANIEPDGLLVYALLPGRAPQPNAVPAHGPDASPAPWR